MTIGKIAYMVYLGIISKGEGASLASCCLNIKHSSATVRINALVKACQTGKAISKIGINHYKSLISAIPGEDYEALGNACNALANRIKEA